MEEVIIKPVCLEIVLNFLCTMNIFIKGLTVLSVTVNINTIVFSMF